MDLEEFEDRMGSWRRNEIVLIRVFLVMFTVLALVQIAIDLVWRHLLDLSFWRVVLGLGSNLVVAYAITSFVLGILFVYHFRSEGIVPMREIIKTMLEVALVVGAFFTLLYALDVWDVAETNLYDGGGPEMTTARFLVEALWFWALTFGGTLAAMAAIMVGGFGIMGMLYIFEVGGIPRLLHKLEGITRKEDTESKAIMWFMVIPGALDTDVMLVDEPMKETSFPWDRFRTAVIWQAAFGIIIGVYVSLNPFLLRAFSVNELFRFVSTAFVVVPLIVIPWFIFKRLNARIKGVNRDFHLYATIKDRMTRLIIAGGTILIFLRLAIESSELTDMLLAFLSYIVIMVLCIIAFTFFYFNFFENRLAEECHSRWLEGRPGPDGDEGGDEGGTGEEESPQVSE
ncbi:MAG: hypothetical protein JSW25_07335 [Thermoplasmata archaeon]|nr:MAG: hypothetical protein JSW25_07335 [Thermoplasmata archaeon]